MRSRLGIASLALAALLTVGCGSFFSNDPSRSGKDVEELKKRVLDLQRQSAVNEVELSHLRQRVAELEAQLGASEPHKTAGESSSSASTATASDPRPTRRGASEIEDLEMEPLKDVETAPTTPPAAPYRAPAPPPSPPPAAPAEPQSITTAAQALYDRGYSLYHQGEYVDAEASFQRFLQMYGETELGDNAQYWIGESRYARQDLQGALAAFRATVERYPQGNKVPDALLKAGQSLEALGDIEGARASYEEVSRRFPGTQAAALAEQRRSKLP